MSLRLRVTYGRTADFLVDVDQQVSRRGLLVRVDVGDIERGAPVDLEIVTPVGRARLRASVLQVLAGAGVAVELEPAELEWLVGLARGAPAGDGPPPTHEQLAGTLTRELTPPPMQRLTRDAIREQTREVPVPAARATRDLGPDAARPIPRTPAATTPPAASADPFGTRTPPRGTGLPATATRPSAADAGRRAANESFDTRTPARGTAIPAMAPAREATDTTATSDPFDTRTPPAGTAMPARHPSGESVRRATHSTPARATATAAPRAIGTETEMPPLSLAQPATSETKSPPASEDLLELAPAQGLELQDSDDAALDADVDADPALSRATSARAATLDAAAAAQQQAQKIQLALHGDKNQRMAILRENNRLLHSYVLKNPQVQLDEVVFMAKMATASADLLTAIAHRREWSERPEVASALVRNPKTPVPLAIKMLDHVSEAELRTLAKQQSVREQIQRAARKKIL